MAFERKKIDWEKIGNDDEGFIGGLFWTRGREKNKDRKRFNLILNKIKKNSLKSHFVKNCLQKITFCDFIFKTQVV